MVGAGFEPRDPGYVARVTNSFSRQGAMQTMGARLAEVKPGEVVVTIRSTPAICQQHGFVHAGVIAAVVDSACGYAALSLMPEGTGVLSIEFKTSLLAPAAGDTFRAVGKVRKPGRNIFFAEGEFIAMNEEGEKVVATLTSTLMCIRGRDGISD